MSLFGSPAMVSRFASLEDHFGQLGKFTILHPSRARELIIQFLRRRQNGSHESFSFCTFVLVFSILYWYFTS